MIRIDIVLPIKYNNTDIVSAVTERIGVSADEIRSLQILRRSLDLSRPGSPVYRASVMLELDSEREAGLLKMRKKVFAAPDLTLELSPWRGSFRPVVVGSGPAGLFAALALAESGARPIVLERGLDVEKRRERVEVFNRLGILDPECNVQFGEGGAGTFSDGKIKLGSPDKYKWKIITELISAGAGEDVAYSTTAHLGTDKLWQMVRAIRNKIISLGGEFRFSAKMTELVIKDGRLCGVTYEQDGESYTVDTDAAMLAVGHSARDTISYIHSIGISVTPKGFGIGLRIEHPREHINSIVYKESRDLIDETASYHLVTHLPGGRSVYSFCMCPGGTVVAASSEAGGVVTNGMSELSRMADNSNAALLVSVTPADFGTDSPLGGFELQRKIERGAFGLFGDYRAPASRLCDFIEGRETIAFGDTRPSYPRGVGMARCEEYLPEYVTDSLRSAIPEFDAWLPGYCYGDAVLTGPETRTTSPVRIERGADHVSTTLDGLYPVGEGAGYAGGILSSATDGLRAAESLIQRFAK